jgi:hypothetical protein
MTQGPGRTLMRSPVVKRQTLPQSGFFPIFSAGVQAERHPPLARCAVFIAVGWCRNMAAPHTSRGAPALQMAATERRGMALGALEPSRHPHPVLRKGKAAHRYAPVRRRCGGGAAP